MVHPFCTVGAEEEVAFETDVGGCGDCLGLIRVTKLRVLICAVNAIFVQKRRERSTAVSLTR